jgi:hypothetical protein
LSTREAVTIASRAFAIYFLAWLVLDLSYLPSQLFSFLHHQLAMGAGGQNPYWRNYDLISLVLNVLRILALFFAVQWFYRSGPGIHAYFTAPSEQ